MTTDNAAIRAIIKQCSDAWNAGNGRAFAAPFAEDADYIIIDGRHARGRDVIAVGHQRIFETIYRDSNLKIDIEEMHFLRPDVAVVCCLGLLTGARGENKYREQARSGWVMTKTDGEWQVASFQNTPIAPPRQ